MDPQLLEDLKEKANQLVTVRAKGLSYAEIATWIEDNGGPARSSSLWCHVGRDKPALRVSGKRRSKLKRGRYRKSSEKTSDSK
jgi:hypothetical protein